MSSIRIIFIIILWTSLKTRLLVVREQRFVRYIWLGILFSNVHLSDLGPRSYFIILQNLPFSIFLAELAGWRIHPGIEEHEVNTLVGLIYLIVDFLRDHATVLLPEDIPFQLKFHCTDKYFDTCPVSSFCNCTFLSCEPFSRGYQASDLKARNKILQP